MPTTVVLVCGWMGASARPVQKYEAMYKALGYHTFTILSHPSDFFRPTASVHKASLEAFHALVASLGHDPQDAAAPLQLVVHAMSNGGCYSWYCFKAHLIRAGIAFSVPALVFDSAPQLAGNVSTTPAAFAAMVKQPFFQATLYYVLYAVFFTLHWVATAVGVRQPVDLVFEMVTTQDKAVPRLFLYSTADAMITRDQVETTIAAAKAHKVAVSAVNFQDSAHVAHYAKYPDVYVEAIKAFLKAPPSS
ncbi:Aste57867_15094 [Aphanomyces stellatus]|uniref:Aste57867_15094 protein n=1 Tax=Aphanomyces stellatus TaxID=120398 RepID=A0A485L2D4_9STRA|nr:hypothetical protein As57867_015038 [Aphanomyces stellatus]VFT91907.1 Aste57867_15094 [Aphanomyces stellatus]